jgi:hypothetical protein
VVNLKAELYWALRERFRQGDIAGVVDQVTISQLASLRYGHDRRNRVEIESKEDARKRGVKSPDRAEALMLAFAPVLADELLAKAWAAEAAPRLGTRQSMLERILDNPDAGVSKEPGGWLQGARW